MSGLVPPVVEPRDFPVGALVRMLAPGDALRDILRDEGRLPADGYPVARVVGTWWSGTTVALLIPGAGAGRISNAYAAPCATQLALVDGELERLTLAACDRVVRAEREALGATAAQARLWESDRAGRRRRGSAVAVARRSRDRAMRELVALVDRPDAPAAVQAHFTIPGRSYLSDAIDAAGRRGFA